jgi:integrase
MSAYRDERDDRWRYRKRVTLPNGQRIRIAGTPATDTKVAAEFAEHEHINRVLHPELVIVEPTVSEPKEVQTLQEYAKDFLECYGPGNKPGVQRYTKQIVNAHLVPFFGRMRLDMIRQCDVDAFTRFEQKRGCARKTINNRLAVLSALLHYAHANMVVGAIDLTFFVDGEKAEDAPIIAVPAEDVARLVAVAKPLYKVVVLLCAEAGLRLGEVRGAQWTDISNGRIKIRRAIDIYGNVGPPKHNKTRTVPLSPAIVAALAAIPKRGLWIISLEDGSYPSYPTMLKTVHRIYKRACVPIPASETGVTRPYHALRHHFGSECARRGVPVMTLRDLMGHHHVSVTQRYVTVTSADMVNAIALAFGASGQQVANTLAPDGAES